MSPATVVAAQAPSSLDLLNVPYAFSQSPLLDEVEFCREAGLRGVDLDRNTLELLHRHRLVVPMFRANRRTTGAPVRRVAPMSLTGTAGHAVRAAAEGRLVDANLVRFRAWPRAADRAGVWYSEFQLLCLHSLSFTLRAMRWSVVDGGLIPKIDRPDAPLVEMFANCRALAIILEVLAPRYLPRILRVVRDPDDSLIRHLDDHVPAGEGSLIAFSPDELVVQAEHLIRSAGFFDPLGSWHRVTRIARPARWKQLRFDALLAQEQRVAAEMILEYHEDLAGLGKCESLPPPGDAFHEARHDRIKSDARARSETILDFELDDHPAVVMALEGATEMLVVRRLLSLFGVEENSGLIRLVDLQGVKGNVQLLARSIAVPRLDADGYRGARLLSPITALVVAVDPEGKYDSEDACLNQRNEIVKAVLGELPAALRSAEMRADLEECVHVITWGTESFEFAHFTDHELATAIRRLGVTTPREDLKAALAKCRSAGGNIGDVWKRAPGGVKLSKPDLSAVLLPGLETRAGALRRTRPLPIVDAVEEAVQLGYRVRRVREMGVKNLRDHPG